jgi:hypothetical protein
MYKISSVTYKEVLTFREDTDEWAEDQVVGIVQFSRCLNVQPGTE